VARAVSLVQDTPFPTGSLTSAFSSAAAAAAPAAAATAAATACGVSPGAGSDLDNHGHDTRALCRPPQSVTTSMSLRYTEEEGGWGRGWVAHRPIAAGEVLLTERAFARKHLGGDEFNEAHYQQSNNELVKAFVAELGRRPEAWHDLGLSEVYPREDQLAAISPAVRTRVSALYPSPLTREEEAVCDAHSLSSQRLECMITMSCYSMTSGLGIAWSPWFSVFNHSCFPNVSRTVSDEGHVEVRALREIAPGDEVCISYVPVRYGTAKRRTHLYQHYGH
jgi:hypothetical protein